MKVLMVFAHPDDETFATGGTIALFTKQGIETQVISATTGQAGQTGEYGDISKDELSKIRVKEHAEAAKILGISKIHYLGLMDGELINHPVSELRQMIMSILEKENPDIIITWEKNGVSNHPDHKQMSVATTEAFKKWMPSVKKHVRLYYVAVKKSYIEAYEKAGLLTTAFGKPQGTPDEHITTVIDITDVFDIKDKAARAHFSQIKDWERFLKRTEVVDYKKEFYELVAENGML